MAGDAEAWERIYRSMHELLARRCRRLASGERAASQLTHAAFLRAIQRCRERGVPDDLERYVCMTACNIHIDASANASGGEASVAIADDDPDTRRDELQVAVDRLSDRERIVLVLCDVDMRSYADAGEALGLSEHATALLLYRARRALHSLLNGVQVDELDRDEACHPNLEAISCLLDGELEGGRRAALDAHLASCSSCVRRRDELQLIQHRYRTWMPELHESADVGWSRIANELAPAVLAEGSGSTQQASTVVRAVGIVAVGVAMLLIGMTYTRNHASSPQRVAPARAGKQRAAELRSRDIPAPTTRSRGINLTGRSLSWSRDAARITISNTGIRAAPASVVRVSIGRRTWTGAVVALEPAASTTVTIPTGCIEGSLSVDVMVDAGSDVNESNERDNDIHTPVTNAC